MFAEHAVGDHRHRLHLAAGPASGPPLLFLHGVCRGWRDFAPLFPAVLPRWHLLAPDFRGHGQSDRRPHQYAVTDYVRDAEAILAAHAAGPAVIYGHSLGALVAMATAAAQPERVRAVILEDPPSAELLRNIRESPYFAQFTGMQRLAGDPSPLPELTRKLGAIPLPGPGGTTLRLSDLRDAPALRFGARCLKDLDPEVLTPLIAGRWLEGYDIEAVTRGVRCPTLIVRGDQARGGMLGRAEAERWAGLMADATLVDVPGVGHLLHWMATETITRLTLNFLESLR